MLYIYDLYSQERVRSKQWLALSFPYCLILSLLMDLLQVEEQELLECYSWPVYRDSQPQADFRRAGTLFQHQVETCALSFFPSKQAAAETLNWFNSQLASGRKLSHSPFLPKQTLCIRLQFWPKSEFLVLSPVLSLRLDIPQFPRITCSPCPLTQANLAPRGATPMN